MAKGVVFYFSLDGSGDVAKGIAFYPSLDGCRIKDERIKESFPYGWELDERVKNLFLMGGLRGEGVLSQDFVNTLLSL